MCCVDNRTAKTNIVAGLAGRSNEYSLDTHKSACRCPVVPVHNKCSRGSCRTEQGTRSLDIDYALCKTRQSQHRFCRKRWPSEDSRDEHTVAQQNEDRGGSCRKTLQEAKGCVIFILSPQKPHYLPSFLALRVASALQSKHNPSTKLQGFLHPRH